MKKTRSLVKPGKSEFFPMIAHCHDVSITFWVYPVTVSADKTEYWAIEDRFVPKDQNGTPCGFTVPRHHIFRFDDIESCRLSCDMHAQFQYLVNMGSNPYDAMSASLSNFLMKMKLRDVIGNEIDADCDLE